MVNFIVSHWYDYIASRDSKKQVHFLNYGYVGNDRLLLSQEEKEHKSEIMLYYHAVKDVQIKNKRVLEVGSGRGGGAYFLSRHFHPKAYYGIDISKKNITFCKRFYRESNIHFFNGDAMQLPFPDAFFDVVINIESSHTYANFPKFLSEAYRVLSPKGTFIFADHREKGETQSLLEALTGYFDILQKENITKNVVKALDGSSVAKELFINRTSPVLLKRLFLDFSGVKGSAVYNHLKSQETLYWNMLLGKKSSSV